VNLQQIAQDHGISVEEVRSRWMSLRVALWKSDFRRFCREVVKIRSKSGDLVSLVPNEAQEIVLRAAEEQLKEERWVRLLACKGRRQGFSTIVAARGFWRATLWQRQRIYLLSHEINSSAVLFDMVALMLQNHPMAPEVGTENAKSLEFLKLGSSYQVATAGQKAGGRGGAVSFFHGSEAAHWPNAHEHFSSSVQSVDEVKGVWGVLWQEPVNPLPFEKNKGNIEGWIKAPSEIFLETTVIGPLGEYWRRYMEALKGVGRYKAVFAPWTMMDEYVEYGDYTASEEPEEEGALSEAEYQEAHGLTDGQMLWRRSKIHELGSIGKFRQEYPIDVTEAFSSADTDGVFIKSALILRARKRKFPIPDAPLIIGVDPAGAGGDRFAIAWRRGDMILKVEHRNKLEHDEAVAWISSIIDSDKPNRVCIDRGSFGNNIISSLRNMNARYHEVIKGVDFGGTSKAKKANPKRAGPWNIRAEIYGRMRDWLVEGGAIPDDDDLASDLSSPKIRYRANNDWILESKTDMRARGVRSPDLADAVALTFAVQEFFNEWSKPKNEGEFGSWDIDTELDRMSDLDNSPTAWMC
jgi:hypothetical protein